MANLDYLVAYGEQGLADLREGNKMLFEAIEGITNLNKVISKTGLKSFDTSGQKAFNKSIEEMTQRLTELEKKTKDLTNATLAQEKAETERRKQAVLSAKEQDILEQTLQRQNKAAKAVGDAYQQLSREHIKLRQEAKALGVIYGTTSKEFLNAADAANKLDLQLKEIDSHVGQHQRSVGNYKSAWNGLGMQVQQVARELPNFAISMNTGIMALSNNLPMLADEIRNVREVNAKLLADGKPTVSLWKQLAAAVFSWQTALIVGIMAVMEWSKRSGEAERETAKLNKTLKEGKDLTKEFAESGAKDYTRLIELKSIISDTNVSLTNRKNAINELQESYPEYFGNLTQEEILTNRVADAYDRATEDMLKKAAFTVLNDQLNESVKNLLQAKKQIEIMGGVGFNKLENGEYDLQSVLDKYIKQGVSYDQKKYGAALQYNAALEAQKSILEDIRKIQEETSSLLGSNNNKSSTQTKLHKENTDAIYEAYYGIKFSDLKFSNEKIQKYFDDLYKSNKENAKNKIANNKAELDSTLDSFKQEEEIQKNKRELYKQLANEILTTLKSAYDAAAQARIDSIEHEKTVLEDRYQKEKDLIDASMVAGKQKEEAMQKLQAKTAHEKEMLNRKERDEKRKMAKADRVFAVGKIIEETAMAIIGIQEKYKGTPQAFILDAIVAAIGAAQLARVMSAPLPQYAKGRRGGRAEFAIVGEQGMEMVTERSGKSWLTGSSAHAAYLSEGARVTPHHELLKQASYYVMKDIAEGTNSRQQEYVMREFLRQNNNAVKELSKNMKRMRNNTTINIDGSHNNYLISKFNR